MTPGPDGEPRLDAFARWRGSTFPPLWHLPAGVTLILSAWAVWTVGLLELAGPSGRAGPGAGPWSTALALASVAGMWPGVWLAVRLLDRTGLKRLIAPTLSGAALGLALGLATSALSGVLAGAMAGAPMRTPLSAGVWATWLVPLVLLVLVQAAGEELAFRGWLLRLFARRSRRAMVWAGLPALAFAAAHLVPNAAGVPGLGTAAIALLFGVAAAALVWRGASLCPAMGLHAGMNLPVLLLAGPAGPLDGALLWRWPAETGGLLLRADLVAMLALIALVLSPACPVRPRAG